jgi:FMN phosphatase YigB (HAD superfamily)
MKWIVFDLDGTLADSSHREHLAQSKQWDEFHSASYQDPLNDDVAFLLRSAPLNGCCGMVLTGRNKKYWSTTLTWFSHKGILGLVDELLMRPDDDFSSDAVVKPRLLAEYFGSIERAREDVVVILEDREKMVECWRNLEFKCWQVRTGAY